MASNVQAIHAALATCGGRLKAERQRLGMSQAAFAMKIGVSKATQGGLEQGKIVPAATVLATLDDAGVDILYVVTGRRVGQPRPIDRQDVATVISRALAALDEDGVALGDPAGMPVAISVKDARKLVSLLPLAARKLLLVSLLADELEVPPTALARLAVFLGA